MLVSSPKAAIAANLGLANRYTGISDGIFAQRTLTGCGIHLNNRLFNSASISATRHALNDNRTALFNNIGVAPHRCNNNNGNNTMNKFMAGMMAMNMMAQLTAKTVQTINEAKAAKAENNGTVKKGTGTDGAGEAAFKAQFESDKFVMSKDLKAATSFQQINKVEQQANEKLNKFGEDYKSKVDGARDNIAKTEADINTTLEGTDVKLDIDLSKLSFAAPEIDANDLSSFDKAAQSIDKNIETVNKFKSDDLAKANKSLITALETIGQEITSLEGSISKAKAAEQAGETPSPSSSELETKLNEAKAKQEKVKTAQKQLNETMSKQVDDLIGDLTAKKTELGDIKQVKADLADKKYQVAEQLQKDIKDTQRQLDNLESKIAKAKTEEDKQKLIKEFDGLVDKLAGYKTDKDAAGDTTITNSKGKSIDLTKAEIKSYTKKGAAGGVNISSRQEDALQRNTELAKQLANVQEGGTVTINGNEYTKLPNGKFKGPDEKEYSQMLLMSMGIASNINISQG